MSKYKYELVEEIAPKNKYVKRSDGAVIPLDEGNSDYQAYLRWLNGEDENESPE